MLSETRRSLTCWSLTVYLFLVAAIFFLIWRGTRGHFCYSVDDAYIHLALAERISHGFYGINLGEASSPSSSFLWPFLLVPFADRAVHLYLPLLWNLLFGSLTAWLLARAVSEWPQSRLPAPKGARTLAVVALVIMSGIAGTPFLGMEHGLQVLLAAVCALGLCRALRGVPVPWWCIVAAAAAPMVRYEDFILTLAVGFALLGERRIRAVLLMSVAAVAPLAGFSIYLHGRGLPLLPLSVLVKGNVSEEHANVVASFVKVLATNIANAVGNSQRWPLIALFVILAVAAWQARERMRRYVLTGLAMAIALDLLIVRLGSLHRYEYFALALAGIVSLHLLWERGLPSLTWYALGLMALMMPLARTLPTFAESSVDVYGQQYQMHRFATEFYQGNVAVNDLGLVSYRIGTGRYVLDIVGLASFEAARSHDHSIGWTEALVKKHDVGLVMMYAPHEAPQNWTPLGELCLPRKPSEVAEQCVSFYSAKPAEAEELERSFRQFAATLPAGVFAKVPIR